jgi:glycosyltransferase involved in cell wall biosynthesis
MSDKTSAAVRQSTVFLWGQFGPYHHDRCQAAAFALPNRDVIGIEVANGSDHHYQWQPAAAEGFTKRTIFPGESYEKTGFFRRLCGLVRETLRANARHNFLCHYDQLEIFTLAVVLRLLGRKVFMMWESKFDDKPRSVWRELLKWFLLRPYNGAITSGPRARAYLHYLGLLNRPIVEGYDSISVERLKKLSGMEPAPGGAPFSERNFLVVARLVEKKNLPLALAAYDLYRRRVKGMPRKLIFLGAGPFAEALKAETAMRGLTAVEFPGFVQAQEIANHMARALALILPSNEEQWGLVVNEALALGVPVLCSENVGARDTLVCDGVNGYVFKTGEAERLSCFMEALSEDELRWSAFAVAASERASLGDTRQFGEGIRQLIEFCP